MHCLSNIGWTVDGPPFVLDHEGHRWNFMMLDHKTFTLLLEDAWLQFVASQVRHNTYAGLQGLDGLLTKLDCTTVSSLDRARISALHSGAFVSAYEHSKYDEERPPMCTQCGCEDDRAHWLVCLGFNTSRMPSRTGTMTMWHFHPAHCTICLFHVSAAWLNGESNCASWRRMEVFYCSHHRRKGITTFLLMGL